MNLYLIRESVSPEVMLGFQKILAVHSCLDTGSHDTLIHTVSDLQKCSKM